MGRDRCGRGGLVGSDLDEAVWTLLAGNVRAVRRNFGAFDPVAIREVIEIVLREFFQRMVVALRAADLAGEEQGLAALGLAMLVAAQPARFAVGTEVVILRPKTFIEPGLTKVASARKWVKRSMSRSVLSMG